jgi:hypothetical protein
MILTIFLVIVISLLTSLSGLLGIKIIIMKNNIAELNLRVALTAQKIKDQFEDDPVSIENTEGFLRFMSESRDWAFKYIEDVQFGLSDFISKIDSDMEYFNKYGLVGSAYPHYDSMKKISEAYKELKKLLPEDYGRIDT